jgi:hypothetical protein
MFRYRFKTTVKSNSEDRLPPVSVVAPPELLHYTQEPDVALYELPNNLSPDEKVTPESVESPNNPSWRGFPLLKGISELKPLGR